MFAAEWRYFSIYRGLDLCQSSFSFLVQTKRNAWALIIEVFFSKCYQKFQALAGDLGSSFSLLFQLIQACSKGEFCKERDYSRTFNKKFLQLVYWHWENARNGTGLLGQLHCKVPRQHWSLGQLRNQQIAEHRLLLYAYVLCYYSLHEDVERE